MISVSDAMAALEDWLDEGDGEAMKSKELILHLLNLSAAPFSRDQFAPGHLTATGLVFHPSEDAVLLVHHARLDRWLLPGGHVEAEDASLAEAAAREVREETGAEIVEALYLAGMDVHGIPPKLKNGQLVEPYHLHHDVMYAFRAATDAIRVSEESREVRWVARGELADLEVPEPILRAAFRRG